ncbi:pilus assembly protein PilP [Cobetia sp. 14N.309.X.WAT.E.A4]|uniref:pilus assembly protein PilP n=1 Tax=Cobetia sp. 14N.309.X.WAT.E.A4 TaxID=2998323 RepID=UPI0025B0D6B5|nr:pilus assembly protein PilP [Cobetia sp. 14N.309.X.WAT.E.A4]MDN2657229.1 pilus assembly protein PilP [Cobetia sp. 14N.309.X.WAT.E.A4]
MSLTTRRKHVVLGGAMLLTLLAGCGDPQLPALESELESLRERPTGQVKDLPPQPEYHPVTYDMADARSPFQSRLPEPEEELAMVDNGVRPDLDRPREPLEAWPMEQLSMVGTLDVDGSRSALILTPEQEVQRVSVGGHMGSNFGRIIRIGDTQLDLVEIVPNGQGGWIERTRAMALTQPADASG